MREARVVEDSSLSVVRAGSWVMYDFANTIYSFAVVTFLLPPAIESVSRSNLAVSLVSVASMVFAGLVVPGIGVWTDRKACTKRLLGWTTAFCSIFCLLLAVLLANQLSEPYASDRTIALPSSNTWSVIAICIIFFGANAFYQIALNLYNSLLVVAAPRSHWGVVSGIGVGVGYLGSLFTMVFLLAFNLSFPPLGIAFAAVSLIVFTIPLILFVPERDVSPDQAGKPLSFLGPTKDVLGTIRLLPRNRVLFFGLLGNFLCVDALNTLILFITVYVQKTVYQGGADPERSVTVLFIALILSSFLASFVNGRLADRIGSMKTLLVSAVFLLIALVFGVLTTAYSTVFFWGVVLTGGMGLTGFWIAGRKMIAEYSPVEHRGLFFGLYGMVTKVGALTTISFALATWMLPEFGIAEATAYRIGMATLLVPVIIGLFLLSKVWSATPPPPGEVNLAQRDIPV